LLVAVLVEIVMIPVLGQAAAAAAPAVLELLLDCQYQPDLQLQLP
jgi:hypothetical protein